jgi:hypothetical protein
VSSGLYDGGRNAFARGDLAWKAAGGASVKAILIDAGAYTVDLVAHANLSDIPAGARIGSAVALTLLDPSAGVCDASDISFTALVGAPTIEALALYKDTGIEATSTLIAYIDSATSGLPTPAGATQVDVTWNNGANKIFKL